VRIELHQHVNVAGRAEILSQDGTEEAEFADAVTPAEIGKKLGGDLNAVMAHAWASVGDFTMDG
jgi:hypothetical protein